jgi:hypothetical protein
MTNAELFEITSALADIVYKAVNTATMDDQPTPYGLRVSALTMALAETMAQAYLAHNNYTAKECRTTCQGIGLSLAAFIANAMQQEACGQHGENV